MALRARRSGPFIEAGLDVERLKRSETLTQAEVDPTVRERSVRTGSL